MSDKNYDSAMQCQRLEGPSEAHRFVRTRQSMQSYCKNLRRGYYMNMNAAIIGSRGQSTLVQQIQKLKGVIRYNGGHPTPLTESSCRNIAQVFSDFTVSKCRWSTNFRQPETSIKKTNLLVWPKEANYIRVI